MANHFRVDITENYCACDNITQSQTEVKQVTIIISRVLQSLYRFQQYDCVIIRFVVYIQSAFKFC